MKNPLSLLSSMMVLAVKKLAPKVWLSSLPAPYLCMRLIRDDRYRLYVPYCVDHVRAKI